MARSARARRFALSSMLSAHKEVIMTLTIIEHTEHPFARGNLTSDGVQWSAEKTNSTDGYETVEEVTVSQIGRAHV